MNAISIQSDLLAPCFPSHAECGCGLMAYSYYPVPNSNNQLIWVCSQGHSTRITYCSQDVVNSIKAKFANEVSYEYIS